MNWRIANECAARKQIIMFPHDWQDDGSGKQYTNMQAVDRLSSHISTVVDSH